MFKKLIIVLIALLLSSCSAEMIRSDKNYVYYEIFVGSFYDTNDDGMGDLDGVTEKLEYLNDLGIGGIWLMPIHPSPTYHKYDVIDYEAIDPKYGTMQDFEELIAKADEYNIEIIIDLVLNHSSSEHPWFIEAKKNVLNGTCENENSYCDYYVFTTTPQGKYYAIGKGYYYEALFWDKMPDLNLDNPKVRDEIKDILQFWLDKGVKGFRLDAVTSFYNQNVTKNTEFLKWLDETVDSIDPEAYVVGEAWTTNSSITSLYQSGIDSLFQFSLSQADGLIASSIRAKSGNKLANEVVKYNDMIKSANPDALNAVFISNHDQGRSAGYFKSSQVEFQKLMASIYLLMPGRSFVYYGEEIALRGSGKDENKRLPMIWDNNDNTGKTLGPSAADYVGDEAVGVKQQIADKNSLYNHYKQLIRIKNTYDVITDGKIESLDLNDNVYALRSYSETDDVIIIHNLSDTELTIEYDFAEYKIDEQVFNLSQTKAKITSTSLVISPYNTVVLIKK
jgi:alpha-amylase